MPAPPESLVHGVAALEVLADELQGGRCPVERGVQLARTWATARRSAVELSEWAARHIVGQTKALAEATRALRDQVVALTAATSSPSPADSLRKAATLQRSVIQALRYL